MLRLIDFIVISFLQPVLPGSMAVTVYMTAPAITVLSVTGLQENVSVLLDGRDRDVMKVWPMFKILMF